METYRYKTVSLLCVYIHIHMVAADSDFSECNILLCYRYMRRNRIEYVYCPLPERRQPERMRVQFLINYTTGRNDKSTDQIQDRISARLLTL